MVGRPVTITFSARRFRCDNARCGQKVFSKQAEGLTEHYSRITAGCRKKMEDVLVEVARRSHRGTTTARKWWRSA